MLQNVGQRLPLGARMLRLGAELQQLGDGEPLLVHNSEHIALVSEHLGSKRMPPGLNSEHIGSTRPLLSGKMLRKRGFHPPREPGMLRMEGDSEHLFRRRKSIAREELAARVIPPGRDRGPRRRRAREAPGS